jgi:hypothetical protein
VREAELIFPETSSRRSRAPQLASRRGGDSARLQLAHSGDEAGTSPSRRRAAPLKLKKAAPPVVEGGDGLRRRANIPPSTPSSPD